VLLDHKGDPIIGRRVLDSVISVGSSLHIQDHLIRVLSLEATEVHSADQGISVPPSITSPFPVVEDLSRVNDRLMTWKIMYSTFKDLDRGRMKSYDGFLELRKKDNFLILNNAKGKQIGCRFKKSKDSFHLGAKLFFPLHSVRMGVPIYTVRFPRCSDQVLPAAGQVISADQSTTTIIDPVVTSQGESLSASEPKSDLMLFVHDAISLGLNFSHGVNFAKDVRNKFSSNVHPSTKSGLFTMVVSFGHSNFKLSED
jgi:hypothetical protein